MSEQSKGTAPLQKWCKETARSPRQAAAAVFAPEHWPEGSGKRALKEVWLSALSHSDFTATLLSVAGIF